MRDDRYSVLRTNGVLFLSGVMLMGSLAAVGTVLGPAPRPEVVVTVAADSVDAGILPELRLGTPRDGGFDLP